jgi:hypothetical protein
MLRFPQPEWFLALGRLMAARGEFFRRIGYADTRFIVRVLPDEESGAGELNVGVVMEGYALAEAAALDRGARRILMQISSSAHHPAYGAGCWKRSRETAALNCGIR